MLNAEPNGTTRGVTLAPSFGKWDPATDRVGPLKGVGSGGMPPSTSEIQGPVVTPVTLNVPLAVDGTLTGPAHSPFCRVPDARFRSVDMRLRSGPLPPVRSR